jgi:RimJ/RimL family protein N-acetyltransferase
MQAPTLFTNRLILRALVPDDFEGYVAMWQDERVTAFIGGRTRPRDECWLKFCQAAGFWPLFGYGYWLIADRGTGVMAGIGGLACYDRGMPELVGFPEVGWAYTANSWGRGYATEALAAMMHWSDVNVSDAEVRCIIDEGNTPSRRVAEKNGFTCFAESGEPPARLGIFRRARAMV